MNSTLKNTPRANTYPTLIGMGNKPYSIGVNILNMNAEELWKDIIGYEGFYQISNLGRVKSLRRLGVCDDKLLKPQRSSNIYPFVHFRKDGKSKQYLVHRLVALAFIPNPENKREVNHIDGDKTNNRAYNLEWVSPRENSNHFTRSLDKTSKHPGVSWNKVLRKWEARIMFRGISYYLGRHQDEDVAAKLYIEKRDSLDALPQNATQEDIDKIIPKIIRNTAGVNHVGAKFNKEQLEKIREVLAEKCYSDQQIANMFGCSRSVITSIKLKKTYKQTL